MMKPCTGCPPVSVPVCVYRPQDTIHSLNHYGSSQHYSSTQSLGEVPANVQLNKAVHVCTRTRHTQGFSFSCKLIGCICYLIGRGSACLVLQLTLMGEALGSSIRRYISLRGSVQVGV